MSTVTSTPPMTAEDLLRIPDAINFELVDGRLLERHMGMESSRIAMRIALLIGIFLEGRRLGHLFGADASYQSFPDDPGKVRKPDVSFIRLGRLPEEKAPTGHCRISPDLVVEVVSPGDLAYDVEEKVGEYLGAGVPLIWVVHPPTQTVRIHRPRSSPRGPISELTAEDAISGEDILPGFTASVAAFFS